MKFTILGVIVQAYAFLKQYRKALLKTWIGFIVALFFIDVMNKIFPSSGNMSGMGHEFIYTIFLGCVVNVIISENRQNIDECRNSQDVILWSFFILLLFTPMILCVMFAYDCFVEQKTISAVLLLLAGLYLIHIICRLLPLLVSVASGVSKPLRTTWEVTKGHSLRLFGIYLLVFIFRLLPLGIFLLLVVICTKIFNINTEPNEWILNIIMDCFLASGAILSLTFHSAAGLQLLGWEPKDIDEGEDDLLLNREAQVEVVEK